MECATVTSCLWHAAVALCSTLNLQQMKWSLAHKWHHCYSAHTFLLSDEANQNTDGVFIQVVRYVGTSVTWEEHKGQRKLCFLILRLAYLALDLLKSHFSPCIYMHIKQIQHNYHVRISIRTSVFKCNWNYLKHNMEFSDCQVLSIVKRNWLTYMSAYHIEVTLMATEKCS